MVEKRMRQVLKWAKNTFYEFLSNLSIEINNHYNTPEVKDLFFF